MSEESLQRGPVSAFGRLRRGKTVLFSGPFTLRAGGPLHFGWSGGTLPAGPNLIVEIPGDVFNFALVDRGTGEVIEGADERECTQGVPNE